jgi:hypothetical protein
MTQVPGRHAQVCLETGACDPQNRSKQSQAWVTRPSHRVLTSREKEGTRVNGVKEPQYTQAPGSTGKMENPR